MELPRRAGLSIDVPLAPRESIPLTKATASGIAIMPKRQQKPKKPVPSRKQPGPTAALRQALTRRTKAELVDVLVELAEADR